MTTIPVELYNSILNWLQDRQDLCAIACASKTLNIEAERLLYRSLAPRTRLQLVKLAKAIIPNAARQNIVRQLDVNIITYPLPRYNSLIDSTLSRLLSRLLFVLPRLNALRLHQWPCWILRNCHHPLLEVLDLCMSPIWPMAGEEAVLLDFQYGYSYMQRHPKIMHMSLDGRNAPPGECQFPPTALPSLVTLCCAGQHFPAELFQNKPIERLALLNPTGSALDRIVDIHPTILQLGARLSVLDMSRCHRQWSSRPESSDDIDLMGEHLPHLQFLAIPAPEGRDDEILSWANRLANSLSRFWTKLVIFRLQFDQGDPTMNTGVPESIAERLVLLKESLKWIIIFAWKTKEGRLGRTVHLVSQVYRRGYDSMQMYKDLDLMKTLSKLGIRYGPLTCFRF
ncbi:hypothetical protein FRC02_006516 [Tulasnella sp. 418]|nr:hypothetical protein FRC02_006516 [Tulasnella sp. 418]